MENEKSNSQNWKRADKTVFMEFSTSAPNQHFLTILQNYDGQRIVIGRVFRKYDNKRVLYTAVNALGKPIFEDIPDLTTLKKKFIEHGKDLAQAMPKSPDKGSRAKEMKEIRSRKEDKEQDREIEY